MKVLLINAPPIKAMGITGQIYPPLGILYLASYAREKIPGLEVQAIDGYKEERQGLVERIINYKPDVIGMSFTTQAATGAYALINEVKERNNDIFIVTGGPHPTIIPEETYNSSRADLAVVGEGEETFYEILQKLGSDEIMTIPGTVVQGNGDIRWNAVRPFIKDLDSIPFPARDLLDIKSYPGYLYKKHSHDTDIMSARGCPFNCTYCSNPVWKSQKPWYRLRSPQNVVDEIEFVMKEYGIREIFDETDEFNGNKSWAKKVCDEIVSRNLDVAMKAQMRVDNVDEELAEKLEKAGFWMVLFGLESYNDKTLKGINKKQTIAQMENALNIMKERDIKCFGLFMAFNVWEHEGKLFYENKEDSLRTLSNIRRLLKEKKLHLFGWSMTTPYPGSRLYEIALRHKLIDDKYVGNWENFDSGSNFVMKLPGVSEKDWIEVLNAGKKLQAMRLFLSGTFNFRAFPLYIGKALSLIKRNLSRIIGRDKVPY